MFGWLIDRCRDYAYKSRSRGASASFSRTKAVEVKKNTRLLVRHLTLSNVTYIDLMQSKFKGMTSTETAERTEDNHADAVADVSKLKPLEHAVLSSLK